MPSNTDTKTATCAKCNVVLKRRSRQEPIFCKNCHLFAKRCDLCSSPVASHNKMGRCLPCQKAHRKGAVIDETAGFDWWEDR